MSFDGKMEKNKAVTERWEDSRYSDIHHMHTAMTLSLIVTESKLQRVNKKKNKTTKPTNSQHLYVKTL